MQELTLKPGWVGKVDEALLIFWESHSQLPFVCWRIQSNSRLFLLQDKAGYPGKLSSALSLQPVKLGETSHLSRVRAALQDN